MSITRAVAHLALVAVLILASCSSEQAGPDERFADPGSSTTNVVDPAMLVPLPKRTGPQKETTRSVPHVQLNAEPVPKLDAELRRRVFSIPGVEDIPSGISLPGARALWLADEVEVAQAEVLLSGREFAHIHPDGSLHVWLPVERALEVDETGWGELHPWVERDNFWDGTVMLFTPESVAELDTVLHLVIDAFNYVTGAEIDPTAF